MSNEDKKKEKKSNEGSRELERVLKNFTDSYKIVESFSKDAIHLQQEAAKASIPAMQEMTRMLTSTYPAIQAIARTMAIENSSLYASMRHIVHITASMQKKEVQNMMKDMASVISRVNEPYVKLAGDIMQMRESFKTITMPINIEPSIIAARNNTKNRITALENALVRLEKELAEKDIENKELRRLIEELRSKNKETYIS